MMDPLDLFLCKNCLEELVEHIFSYLDIGSLRTARCVSCLWRKFIDENLLSKKLEILERRWMSKEGPVRNFTDCSVVKYGYRAMDWKLNDSHVTFEFGDVYEDEIYLYLRPTAGYKGHYAPSLISNIIERYVTRSKRDDNFEVDEIYDSILCALAVCEDYIIGMEMRSLKLYVWERKQSGHVTPIFEAQYRPQFRRPDNGRYTWVGDYEYFRSGCTLKIEHSQNVLLVSPNFHVETPQIWTIEASGEIKLIQQLANDIPNIVHLSKPDFDTRSLDENEDLVRYAVERSHRNIFNVSSNYLAWTLVTSKPHSSQSPSGDINAKLELHIFANVSTPVVDPFHSKTKIIKEKRYTHKGHVNLTGDEFLTDSSTIAIHGKIIVYLDCRQWVEMVDGETMCPLLSIGLEYFFHVPPTRQFMTFDSYKVVINHGLAQLLIFVFDDLSKFADLKLVQLDANENFNTLDLDQHSNIKAVDLLTEGVLRVVNNKKVVTTYHFDTSKR